MARNCRSGFADTLSDDESSKMCYDNFPHYEGIKKEVKEQLINVTANKDFGRLLTLLIPSTTNLLLMLYASSEDFLNVDPFYSGVETSSGSSLSFSSEILLASGKHDEFASTVAELWSSSTFPEPPAAIVDSFPHLPPLAHKGLLSPADAEDVAENKDGSAGMIGEPREKMLLEGAVKEESASRFVGPLVWQTASYADVAAGRLVVSHPAEETTTEVTGSYPKGLVLADFIAPKYKKKGRARKGVSRQNSRAVGTPPATDDQLATQSAGDTLKLQEASGGDNPAEPEVTSGSWFPSPPTTPPAAHTVFCSANELQFIHAHNSPWMFLDKVRQLEDAGKCFAERLAVGELQPDPAAIFFELMQQLRQRDVD